MTRMKNHKFKGKEAESWKYIDKLEMQREFVLDECRIHL